MGNPLFFFFKSASDEKDAEGVNGMSRRGRNFLIAAAAVLLAGVLIVLLNRGTGDFSAKYEGTDLSADVTGISRGNTYEDYIARYQNLPAVSEKIQVDISTMTGNGRMEENGVYTAGSGSAGGFIPYSNGLFDGGKPWC